MSLQRNTKELSFRSGDRSGYTIIRVFSDDELKKINSTREIPENLTLVYMEPKIKSPYIKSTNYYLANRLPFTKGVSKLPDGYNLERKFNSKTAPIVLVKI